MIKPEQIPDEVVEAAARRLCEMDGKLPDVVEFFRLDNSAHPVWHRYISQARAALAAGLAAWPGAYRMLGWDEVVGAQRLELFLPLTEARDE
jgi:hypothetical protein